MYKYILFNLIVFVQICSAQTISGEYGKRPYESSPIKILDQSEFQCVYNHYVYDPKLDQTKDYYELLQIGQNYSKYGSYGDYQLDSIVRSQPNKPMSFNEHLKLAVLYKATQDCIIKNLKEDNLTVYDKVFIDNYVYEEPIPKIEWKLEDGIEEICGHECHKATAVFRGRTWTAWYSNIPVNNGPWKFGNLPGLILKVEDSTGEHRYSAIKLKRDNVSFGYKEIQYFNTTREKFNKAILKYKNEAWKIISSSPVSPKNADGSPTRIPKRKKFFNPIELE